MKIENPPMLIPLKDIVLSKTNPRETWNKHLIITIALSIDKDGLLSPITVRPKKDKYEHVVGSNRYRAFELLNEKEFRDEFGIKGDYSSIPCFVRKLNDDQVMQIQINENAQRENPHPLELARAYKGWVSPKNTIEMIAAKVHKSITEVRELIQLCELIDFAKDLYYNGFFGFEIARELARLDPEKQQLVLNYAKIGSVEGMYFKSLHDVRAFIRENFMRSLDNAPFDINNIKLVPGAGACSQCPKTTQSENSLFADMQTVAGNSCTDGNCWKSKVAANALLSNPPSRKAAGDVPALLKLSSLLTGDADDVLYRDEFRFINKNSKCKFQESGALIDGKYKGSERAICTNNTCECWNDYTEEKWLIAVGYEKEEKEELRKPLNIVAIAKEENRKSIQAKFPKYKLDDKEYNFIAGFLLKTGRELDTTMPVTNKDSFITACNFSLREFENWADNTIGDLEEELEKVKEGMA